MKRYRLYILLLICAFSLETWGQTIVKDLKEEYALGVEALQAMQYQKAVRHFYECVRMSPERADYTGKLAYAYLQAGNYSEAKLYYQKLLGMDSSSVASRSSLGLIYDFEQNYEASLEEYEAALQLDTSNAYYFRQAGFAALKSGYGNAAIAYFNQSLLLNPTDLVVIDELVDLYLQMDRFEGSLDYALELAQKGYQLDSSNFRMIYARARTHHKRKEYDGTIHAVERALSLGDTVPYYQTILAVAYLKSEQSQPEEAVFHLQHVLEHDKPTEAAYRYLGLAWRELEQADSSLQAYQMAIEAGTSPRLFQYHQEMGDVLVADGRLKEALAEYQTAYELQPLPEVLFQLGHCSDQYYKDKKIALRYYERYLKTGDLRYQTFTRERVRLLKENIHLQKTSNQ